MNPTIFSTIRRSPTLRCRAGAMLARAVLLFAAAGAIAGSGGCSQQRRSPDAVEVTLVFENVRLVRNAAGAKDGGTPTLDEWGHIKAILASHSVRPPTERVLRERPIGNTSIRDYESSVLLNSFADMDKVHGDLQALSTGGSGDSWWSISDRSTSSADRIEFQLVGVEALYRSNYIATAIEVFVRGSTTPGATVKLYIGRGASPETATADRRGYFSKKLPALPGDRHIYGESRLDRTPPKFFRIDVLTQRQDALTEDEFREATGTE